MTSSRAIINVLPYLVAVACIASFVRLGFWQLDRAEEKETLIREYETHSLTAPSFINRYESLPAYTPVSVSGSYPQAPLIYLENQRYRGQLGFHIYRVFQPPSGPAILVNAGWIAGEGPGGLEIPGSLPVLDMPDSAVGLMRDPPGVGIRLGDEVALQAAENGLRTPYIAVEMLAERLDIRLAPGIVLLTEPADGFIRDWKPAILPPERHLGYAMQWFSMAAAVLAIATILIVRRQRRSIPKEI